MQLVYCFSASFLDALLTVMLAIALSTLYCQVLNHWARDTLATQLCAVMASSALPQQVWVCLFAVNGPAKEAAYRQTVEVWAPRFQVRITREKQYGRLQVNTMAMQGRLFL